MYYTFIKVIAGVIALIALYLAYIINGYFLFLLIGAFLIFLLAKHFENQEKTNEYLKNIDKSLTTLNKKITREIIKKEED